MKISFRALERADFPLLQRWLAEPHVKAWWNDNLDAQGIEKKYSPRVEGREPTHVFLILCDQKPVGLIQYYLWSDYPAHAEQLQADLTAAGIDLAIGEKATTGRGLGSQIIRQFVTEIIFKRTSATGVIADPEKENVASVKSFEKAGFRVLRTVQLKNETHPRCVVGLTRP